MCGGPEEKVWLAGLKVGDEIFVTQSYNLPPTPVTVSRTTATMVMVKHPGSGHESRYYREHGRSVGSGPWETQYLVQPTDAVKERVEVARLKGTVKVLWGRLTIPNDKAALMELIGCLRKYETIIPKEG